MPMGRMLVDVGDAQHQPFGKRPAAIRNDSGRPSARLNPQGMASAGKPPTLNGIVMLGALTSRSGRLGSARSATVSAAAV